jgi:hypothetical protein
MAAVIICNSFLADSRSPRVIIDLQRFNEKAYLHREIKDVLIRKSRLQDLT